MGHIGLTPQSFHQLGGFKVQGREHGGREQLLADARALEEAGVLRDRARGDSRGHRARDHRGAHASRRSASAPASRATARCSSATTCSAWTRRSSRASCGGSRRSARRSRTPSQQYVGEVRGGTFPSDAESFAVSEKQATQTPLYSTGRREEVVLSTSHVDVAALVDLARGRRVVALTGAGCSTESGIPDYRGRRYAAAAARADPASRVRRQGRQSPPLLGALAARLAAARRRAAQRRSPRARGPRACAA